MIDTNMERRKDPTWNMRGSLPWLAVLCAVIAAVRPVSASEPRVVCYYTNWSVYRPGTARFNPQNINPYLCTHLIYAFGGFTKDNTLKPFDKYQDIEKGGYAKFTGLKTYNKRLKTMLAIGGWNEGSSRFSPMVASKERRKEFVRNSIKFLRQNHFDGLDLDWEYPAFRDGGKPRDRDNYARLVRELRSEFERESEKTGRPRLLLTMAVPAGIEYIQKGFDVQKLNQYLDWMNLLTYDYHSAFEPAANHHSPLYPLEPPSEYSVDSELNIDYTIQFYLDNGADPDKLVLGIPTYGRSYTLYNADATDIGAPADGPGEQGDATREKGYLAYYEICESFKPKIKTKKPKAESEEDEDEESEEEDDQEPDEDLEWTIVQPNPDAMGPYAFRGNQWVGYDDIDIVKKKAKYVAEKGLGGIMFWSIDNDDFRGGCHGRPYPLIEAAKEALITKLGNTDNAIVSDKKSTARSSSRLNNRNRHAVTTTTARTTSKPRITTKKQASIESTTPVWNIQTPEPPTTPDPGSDFKCTDEGFFPHPRDCKKYFWCLDSGPSNLGIVANQFTCPSGLFFNKAADSCDFSRNVVCKVKPATTTTTTTSTSTTTAPTSTTTARTTRITTPYAPPRLVSTSRRPPSRLSTLFQRLSGSTTTTTTTRTTSTEEPSPEEEIAVEEPNSEVDSEDPQVIKELIDLIRKAGGVDQLEKQLKLSEGNAGGKDTTPTPVAIPKNLFERVLGQKRQQSSVKYSARANQFKNTQPSVPGQNSRVGPQNQGLQDLPEVASLRKERPQYTSINRFRSSKATEAPEEEDLNSDGPVEEEEEAIQVSSSKPFIPQYVNIRRARPTTTENPIDNDEEDSGTRFALFERNEPVVQDGSNDEDKNDNSEVEYVTIRRQRIHNDDITTPKYQTIYRTRATPAETTQSIEEEIKLEETVLSKSSTEGTTQLPYVTLLRSRSTQEPETGSEPEIRTETRNEVTETNEPVIVTEAETEIITGKTIIANVQISTLLNNPTESVTSPSAAPVTEPATSPSTTTTTTTTAQTTKRLFPKRTRSTTSSPGTTEEPSTTTAKVSAERNYAFVRRTRPTTTVASVSTDTSSTVPTLTRLANDIPSDSENNAFGRHRNNRFKSVVRKIRSTTPNSREVSVDAEEADYGDKKPAVVNRRRRPTFIKRVTESESQIVSNGENGYLTREDTSIPSSKSPRIRIRKVSTTTAIPSKDDSVHEASEPRNISDDPPALVRQRGHFRPILSASDISSLTAVDNSEQHNFVPRGRSAQVIRRPSVRQTRGPEDIDEYSQDSEDSDVDESPARRPSDDRILRGRSRFSEASTETPELIGTTRNDRKLSFPKFRPRPFTRPSTGSSSTELEDEISSDDRVDNIVEEQSSTVALPPRGFSSRLRFSSFTTAAPNTGNRASNPRISINRTRSGLLPRRPITSTTTEAENTDDIELRISDDIHLSETVVAEKEHDMSTEDKASEQPGTRIILEKIIPQSEDSTQINNNKTTSEKTNDNEGEVNKLEEVGDKAKQRRVKVVFRRPSTPSPEARLDETSLGIQQNASSPAIDSSTPRIRRIIKKKIRPIAVTVSELTITSTESLEITTTEGKIEDITTIENMLPGDDAITTQTDTDDAPTTEIPTDTNPETEDTTAGTDLVSSSTSTLPTLTTFKSKFERPLYRPTRKPYSLTSSTEAPSASISRTYSRKYNIGAYTTPSSSDKESSKLITRKPLFTARPFSRRPYTTVRSTTKSIDEDEDYYSDEVENEQDDKLVFVPENQLFTRGPKEQENDKAEEEEDDLYESYDEDELDEKGDEEVEDNPFKVPPKRLPYVPKTINSNAFRTSSTSTTQVPRKLRPNTSIYQSKNASRTSIFRPSIDDSGKRTQNVPIGYTAPIKPNSANTTKYQPVNNITETSGEVASTTTESNEISTDFTTTEDDDYLSMTDYTSTDVSTNTDPSLNTISTESEVTSTTDEIGLPTYYTTPTYITEDVEYLEDLEASTETAFTTTVLENISTIGHVFAEVSSAKEDNAQTEAISTVTTTTSLPKTTSMKTEEARVFRTHFDKLFSVSRVVEVSSKQDKHRLNKNNESRLIETGEIMVEKKPTLHKIGEVNRFTLIKIVEEEIPIYLTKLSHSYPVENPPNNPITIDEARNARALNNSTDVGKESLVASESINEAYRQINKINNSNKTENEQKNLSKPVEHVVVEEKAIQIGDDGEEVNPLYLPLPMQWQFVPAAYESEKEKENKILKQAKNFEIITPRPFKTEPSTLSLEALFKTENPELYTARKVVTDDSKKVNHSQPFVVYAAPKSTPGINDGNIRKDNKLTNFVKVKILKPDLSRSIKSYAKGQEFGGFSRIAEDSTIKYPVSIKILESDKTQDVTTVRTVFTTISDVEMYTVKSNIPDVSFDTSTTSNILPTTSESTTENPPATTDSTEATTDSTESSTLVSIITRGALSLNARNRPKLTFPRRYQSNNSNITRISVSPLANSPTTPRSFSKNNQTSPHSSKFNRTNNFSQGKSRFSSSRSQNVPVDIRVKKGKDISRSYQKQPNTTSEVQRIQPVSNVESSTRKLYFKPIRPSILRGPSFVPRKANTPPVPQVSEE